MPDTLLTILTLHQIRGQQNQDFKMDYLRLILATATLYWVYQVISSHRRGLPPGPFRLPGIGCILQVLLADYKLPPAAFSKLRRIYGDIMSIQTGTVFAVVVNGYKAIREVESNENIMDRAAFEWFYDRTYGKKLGIIFAEGRFWHETREYTIRTLRDFGFGKIFTIETIIKDELEEFVQVFREKLADTRDGVMNMTGLFNALFMNVIWCLVNGERFSYRDPKFQHLLDLVHDVMKSAKYGGGLLASYPILQKIAPNFCGFTRYHEANLALRHYFEDMVERYKKKGNYKVDPNNFIEIFLNCIEANESSSGIDTSAPPSTSPLGFYLSDSRRQSVISIFNNKEKIFTRENLVSIIYDMFFAGSETSSNVLSFAIIYLIRNQGIQNNIRDEIDRVVGRKRLVAAGDRNQMKYTEAVVLEALRISTAVPMNPRKTTSTTQVGKYTLPADTMVYVNLYSANMDNKVWENPHQFRPERFLTPKHDEVINQDKILTFGSGQRSCMCETVARLSIFLALANLIQNFEFHVDPTAGPPSTEIHAGLTSSPMPYMAHIKARK